MIYETEEEQVAALKGWWKENGISTIAGIVAGIVLIVGWNFWQGQQEQQAYQAAGMYDELLKSFNQKKYDSVEKIAQEVDAQFSNTSYARYSDLFVAKSKVEQGDLEGAQAILKKLMNDADSSYIRHIARVRIVKLLWATGKYEAGLQMIAEADQSDAGSFSAIYDELTGDLYVALGRLGEARTAYQSALRSGSTSALLQFKLEDLTPADTIKSGIIE